MKNKLTIKKLLKKEWLFSILLLLLNGIPHLSFSQDVPPPSKNKSPLEDEPVLHKKYEDSKPMPPGVEYFPPDFVTPQDKTRDNQQPVPSLNLTPEQIKKIISNDKVIGKDSQGHQLYQNSKGETYYLIGNGTKVILK